MLIHSLTLIAGLIALFFSASKFVTGAASIARNLALSPLFIGLTVVGFGTAIPEILMSGFASFDGNSGLAAGNALGANIANIGLVLGAAALIKPMSCQNTLLKQQLIVLLILGLLSYFISFDGLGVGDSLLLLVLLVIFLIWLVVSVKKQEFVATFAQELKTELPDTVSAKQAWIYVTAGALGLLISAKLSVWAAMNVAHLAGLSDLIIGLTAVAIATSLPELATAISCVLKKQDELAVGNIISSSIYNLLAVYALPGLIDPGTVADGVLSRDFPVMLGFTLLALLLSLGIINKAGSINRWAGAFLLGSYSGYLWLIYQQVTGI